jgi:hypothetical protein
MLVMPQENKQAKKLVGDILIFSRNLLLVNLRFLDVAISQLELKAITFQLFENLIRHAFVQFQPLTNDL